MRHRHARIAAVAAVLALTGVSAAGCGSDDDAGGRSAGEALTAEEWRAQADAICKDIDARLDAIPAPANAAGVRGVLEAGLPIAREQVERLEALAPPPELERIQTEAVAKLKDSNAQIQKALDRIVAGEDPTKVVEEADPGIQKNNDELDKLAAEGGLKECASD